jgi:hypothetical protein
MLVSLWNDWDMTFDTGSSKATISEALLPRNVW